MITPPLSISARPVLTRSVPISMAVSLATHRRIEATDQAGLRLRRRGIRPHHQNVRPADAVGEDLRLPNDALDAEHDLMALHRAAAEGDDHVDPALPRA